MYRRYYTANFQKSFKKIIHSGKFKREKIEKIVDVLASGEKLPLNYRDHLLHGEYDGYRECHIHRDLLLIYKIQEAKLILILVDIGSHSDLFE